MSEILATPRHMDQGTKDSSTRKVKPVLNKDSQFVPFFTLNTPKGDYRRHHVTGGEAIALFGLETFLPTSVYATHASVLCHTLLGASGNSVVIQRAKGKIKNEDGTYRLAKSAKKTFFLAYYLDDKSFSLYKRNADGTIAKDENNNLLVEFPKTDTDVTLTATQAESGMIKWVEESGKIYTFKLTVDLTTDETNDVNNLDDDAGTGKWVYIRDIGTDVVMPYRVGIVSKYIEDTSELSEITVNSNGITIKMVPLFTVEAEAHGSSYNDYGIALDALTGFDADTILRDRAQTLAYKLRIYDKNTGTKRVFHTTNGGDDVKFSLKPYSSDPQTGKANGLEDMFPGEYGNYIDPDRPLQGYTFKKVKIHDRNNLEVALKLLMKNENATLNRDDINPILSGLSDFPVVPTADADVMVAKYLYLLNILTYENTNGIGYESIREIPTEITRALRSDQFSHTDCKLDIPTYLENGEDGILDDLDVYEDTVVEEFQRYADINDPVNSLALNRETVFLDSGFKFDRKLKLAPFISNRPDTLSVFAPEEFDKDNRILSLEDTINRANMLKSILSMYTESKAYGTPTMRAAIIMGSGIMSNGLYRYRMPMVLDWGVKAMKYYGGLDGNWNPVYEFSTQDNNIVRELIDVEPKYIPKSVKDKLYTAGLIWVDNEDEIKFFYPGQQTIYPNDTSVLNSIKTVIAACTIHRVNDKIWRKYSGVDNLTNLELKMNAEKTCDDLLKDRFDNAIKYTPEVYYTIRDEQLGWLWRLRVHMYANNMKTVMYSDVEALRMSDYGNNK